MSGSRSGDVMVSAAMVPRARVEAAAVCVPRPDFCGAGHPRPRDVLLGIEVMASSRSDDRTPELPLYAKAELREVWLVDPTAQSIEVHRRAARRGYRSTETFGRGQVIRPGAFPRVPIRVNEILG